MFQTLIGYKTCSRHRPRLSCRRDLCGVRHSHSRWVSLRRIFHPIFVLVTPCPSIRSAVRLQVVCIGSNLGLQSVCSSVGSSGSLFIFNNIFEGDFDFFAGFQINCQCSFHYILANHLALPLRGGYLFPDLWKVFFRLFIIGMFII